MVGRVFEKRQGALYRGKNVLGKVYFKPKKAAYPSG